MLSFRMLVRSAAVPGTCCCLQPGHGQTPPAPPAARPSPVRSVAGHWLMNGYKGSNDNPERERLLVTERATLDQVGMPHSDALHVIERYRRTAADAMEVAVTIDDPKIFTRSWETKATYRAAPATMRMDEHVCENNRNMPDASGKASRHPASDPLPPIA